MIIITGLVSKAHSRIFACVAVLVLSGLSGCTSTQGSLSYYLLHSAVSSKQSEALSQSSIGVVEKSTPLLITSITLPDYLKHRGLVYQVSDTNLHISTTHLWAEPFEEGLRKTLRDQLANEGIVMLTTTGYQADNIVELSLHISDFVSTFNGNIVFKGEFVLTSEQTVNGRYSFFIETQLEEDGFSASVIAMRKALAALSSNIAEHTSDQ
ncbi:PqiC family protein [Alteromonas sp. BMJM2]|uniref:PqiC family protein n=1 Tax=Alteromonas sp. BMJM2 TaxID=2954241 RepID=UPI0022B5B59E|nr:PqiC family protein [Alteromonas sp. BMJM2]